MSFEDLKKEVDRQRVLWALADRPARWTSELAVELLTEHLSAFRVHEKRKGHEPVALRLDLSLLPEFWVRGRDLSQVDGRVLVKGVWHDAVQLQILGGPSFTLTGLQVLEAIAGGKAMEAQ